MIPLVLTLILGQSLPATSQTDSTSTAPVATVTRPMPFGAGERMEYVARMGPMNPGRGSMEIVGVEDVRGRTAVHTRFQLRGRAFFFSANYLLESWVDQATFTSLRFTQDNDGDPSDKDRIYEIFPERQTYSVNGGAEVPSVADPLDEGALLYLVRTMDLQVGKTYELNRYFRPDRNPVIVKVLRKEKIKVPAGTFNTIVIQPIIKAKGIFSEGGKAQIYLSDDKDRIMVQLRVHLKANIDISLQLTKYTAAANASQ
jgi:uncharacterized protein DUF3108